MKLFRKKEDEKATCCCGGNCTPEAMQEAQHAQKESGIKILGSGCAKCIALEKATISAIKELGLDFDVKHIEDFAQIASYGVMTTPALVVDGNVVSYGKVLTIEEVKTILTSTLLNK